MIVKRIIIEKFEQDFPWFEVAKYKVNRKDGGIDITLKDGTILNYSHTSTGWVLKGGIGHV